jgi:hypothetical protein
MSYPFAARGGGSLVFLVNPIGTPERCSPTRVSRAQVVRVTQSQSLPRRLCPGATPPHVGCWHCGSAPFLIAGRRRGHWNGLWAHLSRLLLGEASAASGSSTGCRASPTGRGAPGAPLVSLPLACDLTAGAGPPRKGFIERCAAPWRNRCRTCGLAVEAWNCSRPATPAGHSASQPLPPRCRRWRPLVRSVEPWAGSAICSVACGLVRPQAPPCWAPGSSGGSPPDARLPGRPRPARPPARLAAQGCLSSAGWSGSTVVSQLSVVTATLHPRVAHGVVIVFAHVAE